MNEPRIVGLEDYKRLSSLIDSIKALGSLPESADGPAFEVLTKESKEVLARLKRYHVNAQAAFDGLQATLPDRERELRGVFKQRLYASVEGLVRSGTLNTEQATAILQAMTGVCGDQTGCSDEAATPAPRR